MTAVVFQNQGLIDIRAFTVMGINSKPNSDSPIGFFGTGLKYAIAVLVREGMSPVLWIGGDKYTFTARREKFRDKDFDFIRMKTEKRHWFKPQYTSLPFTTELGKNWKLWQAFRELESNTRDENGSTFLVDSQPKLGGGLIEALDNTTTFIVEGDAFVDVFNNMDDIFLAPTDLNWVSKDTSVEILYGDSPYLYFRGLRVKDFPEPKRSKYTYNILEKTELTEDRTVKYEFEVMRAIARHVSQSDDEAFIEDMITAPKEFWEHELSFDYIGRAPSETFKRVLARNKTKANRSAYGYYRPFAEPRAYAPVQDFWQLHPTPWRESDIEDQIVDAQGHVMMTVEDSTSIPHILEKINGVRVAAKVDAIVDEVPY